MSEDPERVKRNVMTSFWKKNTLVYHISNLIFLLLGNVQCNDGVSCSFDNLDWDGEINSGDILDVAFVYHYNSNSEISAVSVNGVDICGSNVVRYVLN